MAKSVWQKFSNLIVTGDLRLNSNAELKTDDGAGTVQTLSATFDELNQVADASARVVATTATVLALTVTEHADRVVLVNTNSTVANTVTLPLATGSGNKYYIRNNIVQTQGSVVVAANGTTNVLAGKALAYDSTAVTAAAEVFLTSATSDKVTFNLTTTGGLGHDTVTAVDTASGVYTVDVEMVASGNLATPFSAT